MNLLRSRNPVWPGRTVATQGLTEPPSDDDDVNLYDTENAGLAIASTKIAKKETLLLINLPPFQLSDAIDELLLDFIKTEKRKSTKI